MEQNNNSGAIFRNEKKEKQTSPDYSGSAKIDGKDYLIVGWLNKSREGKNYLRVLFTIKDLKNQNIELNTQNAADDLPF